MFRLCLVFVKPSAAQMRVIIRVITYITLIKCASVNETLLCNKYANIKYEGY